MRIRKLLRLGWVGAIAALGVLGAAHAQNEVGTSPASTTTGTTAAGTNRTVVPTMAEMVDRAIKMTSEMEAAGKNVSQMLSKAREDKDVVKVLCLDDKVNQIDVTQRSASERVGDLKAAVSANDEEAATHHYTIIIVLKDRVVTVATEANQCIGVEAGYVGATKVTVDIDPNIPSDDPSEYPPGTVITVPPSCASCVQ